jgi:hypothetical protein
MNEDLKHLNLLSVFHYIVGGLSALFSCMFLIHLFLGLAMLISPESLAGEGGEIPPAFLGYMFTIMGAVFFLFGMAISACIICSGRFLGKQKKYLFSFVMACIECLFMPFGTVLGIFTIIVLSRDSVKRLYGLKPTGQTTP